MITNQTTTYRLTFSEGPIKYVDVRMKRKANGRVTPELARVVDVMPITFRLRYAKQDIYIDSLRIGWPVTFRSIRAKPVTMLQRLMAVEALVPT